MFAFEGENDVWLCCRMSDGSIRSLGAVIGSPAEDEGFFAFEYSPSQLPVNNVTSPDQIGFSFTDTYPEDAPYPVIEFTPQVKDFQISEGSASYIIEIYAEGVRVSVSNVLVAGDSSPLVLRAS